MKSRASGRITLVALVSLISSAFESLSEVNPINVTNINLGAAYSVAISGHYAYVASQAGMRVLNISNPVVPVQVALAGAGTMLVTSDTNAYLLNAGLAVWDISTPSNPVAVGQMQLTNCCYNDLSTSGHYVYATSASYGTGGITICDVSNPTNPVQAGVITVPSGSIPYAFQASGNYGYMALNDPCGLSVWDVSAPATPINVGVSANLPLFVHDVAVSGSYAYVAADTNGLQVYDVSNPAQPINISPLPTPLAAPEHNVIVSGNYAYVFDGTWFSVVDISNPTNAAVVFRHANGTSPALDHTKMAVAHGYAYFPTADGLSIWSLGIPRPQLSMGTTPTNTVVLFWPAPTGAFVVQQSPSLNPVSWVTLTNAPVVSGSENQVIIPSPASNMFYRLISE